MKQMKQFVFFDRATTGRQPRHNRLFSSTTHSGLRYVVMLLCLLTLGVGEAWAGGSFYTHLRVFSENTAKGLVYASTSSSPSPTTEQYRDVSLSDKIKGSDGANLDFYAWAKPARGYKFSGWTAEKFDYVNGNYSDMTNFYTSSAASDPEGANVTIPKGCDGDADNIKSRSWGGGKGWEVANTAKAGWIDADKYIVRYKKPTGGSYSIKYSYLKTEGYVFKVQSENVTLTPDYAYDYWTPEGLTDNDKGYSYETDTVQLTVSADVENFLGWYEGNERISDNKELVYEIEKSADVEAKFRWATFDEIAEQTINTNSNNSDEELTIVVNPHCTSDDWTASQFSIEFDNKQGEGSFEGDIVSYSQEDGLKISITFNANDKWGGSGVTAKIVPEYGETLEISIIALAERVVDYQACVLVNEEEIANGTLMKMLDYVNSYSGNGVPTLQLTQDVEISTTLQVQKTMILDLNGKKLTSSTLATMINNAMAGGNVSLTIQDNSFLHTGEISMLNSIAGNSIGIDVDSGNRLLIAGGRISSENSTGSAYGIRVAGNSSVVMSGGSVLAQANEGAYGIYVAGSNGYATLNGGNVNAQANSDAYSIWSAGTANITNTSLSAKTTIADNAEGICVMGGNTILDNTHILSEAAGDKAYGVDVREGRLVINRSELIVTAHAEESYGVNIHEEAQAVIQNASITAMAAEKGYANYNSGSLQVQNSTLSSISTGSCSASVLAAGNATKTIIEDGLYEASSVGGTTYAVQHIGGELVIDGGTYHASSAGDNVYAVYSEKDASIKNATLNAETTGVGKNVFGFSAAAGTIHTIKSTSILASSASSMVVGVESNGRMTLSDCNLTVKTLAGPNAYGVNIQTGTLTMTNTNVDVSAYTTGAYGLHAATGAKGVVNGGNFTIVARQAATNAEETSVLYGIKINGECDILVENAKFDVSAENTSRAKIAYGVYTSGKTELKNCTFDVKTRTQSYGVWGDDSSDLNLNGNEILSVSTGATTSYGVYSNGVFTIAGGKVTSQAFTTKSYALFFDTKALGVVASGKYKAIGTVTSQSQEVAPVNTEADVSKVEIKGGFFEEATNVAYYTPESYNVYAVSNNAAEYAEGYYYQVNNTLSSGGVCYIPQANNAEFLTLEAAMDYTRDHPGTSYTIVMTQPYKLVAGTYTLPSNATLLVPYSKTQNAAKKDNPDKTTEYQMLAEHLRLTFADGVKLNVDGVIEVGAEHYYTNIGRIGTVQGSYGRLHLENGCKVVMNSGACLYAWGYVTGEGEIFVKKGAKVYEDFQVNGMPNGPVLLDPYLASANEEKYKVFPINQYYIQNVEAPTRFYYGSSLTAIMWYNTGLSTSKMQVMLVGDNNALFKATLDDESSWVRKVYDYQNDRCIWETNTSAEIGSLLVDGGGSYTMDSKAFVLPISNNMKIHVRGGRLDITQSMVLLAGAQIEVDKEATLVVKEKDTNTPSQDITLYLYDKDEWGQFAYGKYAYPIQFSPSWINGKCPRGTEYKDITDASIYVKGKLEINGTIRTTIGGANIYSDIANAGTIDYKKNAPEVGEETVYVYASNTNGTVLKDNSSMTDTYRKAVIAAKLKNAEGYTSTTGTQSGYTYCYMDMQDGLGDRWVNLVTTDACLVQDQETGIYYAKPSSYVALSSGEEDVNHLYHAAENNGITYIRQSTDAGCQWWKVVPTETSGVYYCADNGIYYKYNNTTGWDEVRVEVTFYLDEDKSISHNLTVNYGAKPDADIISNPSKSADVAATYQFFGWKSSVTQNEYAYTAELEEAKEDMYYTPIFTSLPKNYTITLNDANNGAAVPVEVPYGEVPSYTPKKDADAQYTYTFEGWTPALQAVNGPATYTANWSSVVNRYTITWMDGETVLETDKNLQYGTATSFEGDTPVKEADNEYAYAFSGWLNSLTGNMRADNETVTGAITYTAQYNTTPRYMITFANYDGTQLQKEAVTQGEPPIYNGLTPGRTRDLDGYYKFIGWKNSNGDDYAPGATLPEATAKETYTAQYEYVTELYTITLNNIDGNNGSWSGKFGVGSTPFYDPDNNDVADEPTKASTDANTYEFDYWIDESDTHYLLNELPAVTAVATYTAHFAEQTRKYDITFANLDGNGAQQTIKVEYGTTPVSPVTPTKEEGYNTYAFTGWSQAIASVSGDATYTAQFSGTPTVRQAQITFDLDNGSTPTVVDVDYGTMPAWSGATPTKAADAQYTYTFAGWYPALGPVTGDETYSAQYTQTLNTYTVTFKNYDGTVLDSKEWQYGATPSYSGTTAQKPADMTDKKVYTFDGWSSTNEGDKLAALPAVNGEAIYYAHYSEETFVASLIHGDTESYKTSWDLAYSDAQTDDIIKLYDNLTFTAYVTIQKNITIDLNGYTMYRTSNYTSSSAYSTSLLYVNNVSVTINDSQGEGLVHFNQTATESNSNAYAIYVTGNNGVLTINGGTIKATRGTGSYNASAVYMNITNSSKPKLYLNDGELIAMASAGNQYAIMFTTNTNGNAYINGGKLKASTNIFSNGNATKVTASGGYFSQDPGTIGYVTGYEKQAKADVDVSTWKYNDYGYRVAPTYEVAFQDGNGTTLQSYTLGLGKTPTAYSGSATPTKAKDDEHAYKFNGTWSPDLAVVTGPQTYTAQFDATSLEMEVNSESPLNVSTEVNITTVTTTGSLSIAENQTLTTNDLIIEASPEKSGELVISNDNQVVAENVYFDLTRGAGKVFKHHTWYAFSVPFQVDAAEILFDGQTMQYGQTSKKDDYDILYYDGSVRAAQGKAASCWKYVEKDDPTYLYPGKLYMIANTRRDVTTLRFTKVAGSALLNTSVDVNSYSSTTGYAADANWNGIANPAVFHANMSELGAAEGKIWVYNPDAADPSNPYEEHNLADDNIILGQAFFVQTPDPQTLVVSPSTGSAVPVARRRAQAKEANKTLDRFQVTIAPAGEKATDNVIVRMDENKEEDKYIIGTDLVRMGMSTMRPQLWVDRYDEKLCVNVIAPTNGQASYPLGIFAPNDGEYQISVARQPDNETTLYLTLDGKVIWNLNYNPYTATLTKGNTGRYGLLMVGNKAPEIATGVDEAVVDANGATRKVLINNHIYIIRGDQVYTINGQKIH